MTTYTSGIERQGITEEAPAPAATQGPSVASERPADLVTQFGSMPQQFSAAKLGMWLFLATEVLLFGGLFCAYAVFRANHFQLFAWGSRFLDVRLGCANTVILILSSVSMALAVTFAQRGHRWLVVVGLGATFLFGVMFLAIKSVEYEHKFHENLVWGAGFYESPDHLDAVPGADDTAAPRPGDLAKGTTLWSATCRSCHGIAGEGVVGQGRDIRASEFIQSRDDSELLAFVKVGRLPGAPLNTTGLQMPPRGGNPILTDRDLIDIFAYIRSFQMPLDAGEPDNAGEEVSPDQGTPDENNGAEAVTADAGAATGVPSGGPTAGSPAAAEGEFWIPRSVIPPAATGPRGLSVASLGATLRKDRSSPPANAHIFFGLYFCMTGLHALHVLAGMGVIAWLMFKSVRGSFGRDFFTPVDLGGLYWHIVDLVWIFLFALLYLI